jgi:hypothetical protein
MNKNEIQVEIVTHSRILSSAPFRLHVFGNRRIRPQCNNPSLPLYLEASHQRQNWILATSVLGIQLTPMIIEGRDMQEFHPAKKRFEVSFSWKDMLKAAA